MDPLEHIVWLQSRCPDEYDRGHVIAKGSTSLATDLFGVSVSGEDGTFTSVLTILEPTAKGAGGVFRCEAWPHPGYGRHKRQLTPTMLGETPEASERQGRAHQDPWNAIILGGSELIEECFYGGYEDKWRKLRALNTGPALRNAAPISSRRLSDVEDQSGPVKFIPRTPVEHHEYDMTQGTLPFVPTEPTYHATPVTPMPVPEVQQQLENEPQSSHPPKSQEEVLLSELHDPEVRLQFLRSLSPEQLHGLRQSMLPDGTEDQEPHKVVVLTNMQPFQRLNEAQTRMNEEHMSEAPLPQRSTPTVRAPKSGLEVRTNMVPLHRFANSRMLHFSPDNATQSS
ncbi:hypothetical protein B566_EDAN007061 [Ephemera danica]|nr:hypothetical protein B566_EDAN007061 [Ephemera danica]